MQAIATRPKIGVGEQSPFSDEGCHIMDAEHVAFETDTAALETQNTPAPVADNLTTPQQIGKL